MTTPKLWNDLEVAQLKQMKAAGHPMVEIAEALGRSICSVENKSGRLSPDESPVAPPPADTLAEPLEVFKSAALEAENNQLRQRLASQPSAAGVVSQLPPEENFDAVGEWARIEKRGVEKLDRASKIGRFSIDFPDGPIIITAISDQHIGGTCDYVKMREDAELIRDTEGVYAVLLGDGVDNHVKHRAAMIAAGSKPDDQWRLYDYYLQLFGESLLVVISGNHDAFTSQVAGVDMVAHLADVRRFCYAPAAARLDVKVGDVEYFFSIRHQYRFNSNFNQGHTVKRLYDMGEEPFDVGIIGHHHEAAVEMFMRHGRERWAARPGSYQRTSPYTRQFGFNPAYSTCPSFVLFPGGRRIIGFVDLRDALFAFRR
jgi:predicted phosphodiesterase